MPAYTSDLSSAIYFEEFNADTYPYGPGQGQVAPDNPVVREYESNKPRPEYQSLEDDLHADQKVVNFVAGLVPILGQLLAPGGAVGSAAVSTVQSISDLSTATTTAGKASAYANIVSNLVIISRGLGGNIPITDADLDKLAAEGMSPSKLKELKSLQKNYGPNFFSPQLAKEILDELGKSQESSNDTVGMRVDFYPGKSSWDRYYYSRYTLGTIFDILLARAKSNSGLVSNIYRFARFSYDHRERYGLLERGRLNQVIAYTRAGYRESLVESFILNFGDRRVGFDPEHLPPLEREIYRRTVKRDERGRPTSIGGDNVVLPRTDRRASSRLNVDRREHSTRANRPENKAEIEKALRDVAPGTAYYVDERQLHDLSQLSIQAASLISPARIAVPVQAARYPVLRSAIDPYTGKRILEATGQTVRAVEPVNLMSLSSVSRASKVTYTVAPRGTGSIIGIYDMTLNPDGTYTDVKYTPINPSRSRTATRRSPVSRIAPRRSASSIRRTGRTVTPRR